MNIDILRIHKDYVTELLPYRLLASPGGTKPVSKRGESKHPAKLQTTTYFSLGLFFWSTRTRESTSASANNSVLKKKYINKLSILSWTEVGSKFYQPRKTIRVSEILKMNSTLRYFLSLTLKLAWNHIHISISNWYEGWSHSRGTPIEF